MFKPILNLPVAELSLSGEVQVQWASFPPLSWGRRVPDDLLKSPPALFSVISDKFAHLCIRQASYKRSDTFSIWLQPFLHNLFTHLPPLLNFHSISGWTVSTGSSVMPLYSTKSPGSYTDLCYRLTVWPLDILMLFIRFTIDKNLENPMGTLQGFINECLPPILYPKIKDSRIRNSITAGI